MLGRAIQGQIAEGNDGEQKGVMSLEQIGTSLTFVMRAEALTRTRMVGVDEMKDKETKGEGEVVVENPPSE